MRANDTMYRGFRQQDHQRLPATPRHAIECAIEALISLLDTIDGDPDLEAVDEREPENESATVDYGIDQRELRFGLGGFRRLD